MEFVDTDHGVEGDMPDVVYMSQANHSAVIENNYVEENHLVQVQNIQNNADPTLSTLIHLLGQQMQNQTQQITDIATEFRMATQDNRDATRDLRDQLYANQQEQNKHHDLSMERLQFLEEKTRHLESTTSLAMVKCEDLFQSLEDIRDIQNEDALHMADLTKACEHTAVQLDDNNLQKTLKGLLQSTPIPPQLLIANPVGTQTLPTTAPPATIITTVADPTSSPPSSGSQSRRACNPGESSRSLPVVAAAPPASLPMPQLPAANTTSLCPPVTNPFARLGAYPTSSSGGPPGGGPPDDPRGPSDSGAGGRRPHRPGSGFPGGSGGGGPGGPGGPDNSGGSAPYSGHNRDYSRVVKLPFPAKYSGLPGSPTFTKWDLVMRRYFQAQSIPETQWLLIFMTNLEHRAQDFIDHHHLQVELHNIAPFHHWKDFCAAMRKFFEPTCSLDEARRKLKRIYQHSTVELYVDEFRAIQLQLPFTDTQDLFVWFVDGLKEPLRSQVQCQCTSEGGVETAISTALRLSALRSQWTHGQWRGSRGRGRGAYTYNQPRQQLASVSVEEETVPPFYSAEPNPMDGIQQGRHHNLSSIRGRGRGRGYGSNPGRSTGSCFFCKSKEHVQPNCPHYLRSRAVFQGQPSPLNN